MNLEDSKSVVSWAWLLVFALSFLGVHYARYAGEAVHLTRCAVKAVVLQICCRRPNIRRGDDFFVQEGILDFNGVIAEKLSGRLGSVST